MFYRMGFNDQEIVALSGAHTLGRAKPSRAGFGKEATKYTKDGPGNPGANVVPCLLLGHSNFARASSFLQRPVGLQAPS